MIRYALLCRQDHAFEAWFRDSLAFDIQSDAGQVGCPQCGSADIRKALMAPAIRRTPSIRRSPEVAKGSEAENGAVRVPEPTPPATALPIDTSVPALSDDVSAHIRASLRELHARLKATAEDVGSAFPDEARRIHDGEEPARAIYGTATDHEVRSLIEDGIGILPIPALPEDRN